MMLGSAVLVLGPAVPPLETEKELVLLMLGPAADAGHGGCLENELVLMVLGPTEPSLKMWLVGQKGGELMLMMLGPAGSWRS